MTNLDSMLKSPKNGCFWTVVLEKTLECPLDSQEIQPVHPKEISPEYSLEGLMLKVKLQCFGHLMQRTDSLEKTLILGKIEGGRRGQERMKWWDGITYWMHMSLSKLCEVVLDREACRAVVHGVAKSRTQLSDWTETESLGLKYLFLGEGFSLRTNISRCVGKLSWELLWVVSMCHWPVYC